MLRYTILLLAGCAAAPSAPTDDALEKRFDALIRGENLKAWMEKMAARPHHLGSPYDREVVDFIAARFKEWGYETAVEEFRVLFPTPKTRLLERGDFKAKLEEPALPEDKTSGQKDEQLPVYNAYSIDGDVTGELVYVNTGVPKDYEELERRGVDVRGKIVIARYGGSWRGIKPKAAAERGAIGCVIYSDPREDGYAKGDVYPKGAFRAAFGAQRGSVMDLPLRPGDPQTPGYGSLPGAKRLDMKDVETFTKIPVLPISYEDALPLLRSIGGPVAPEAWQGALPLTYHLGPGARVRLKVDFDWKVVPCFNVIAKLKGREFPDSWVLRGNHHDAWVNGADDPVSGMEAVMEEARVFGELAKTGWRPRRTMVYCAWGGEEQGLLGSVEWAETHAEELKAKAVAYVNSDNNARGFLRMLGSHSLEKLVNAAAREVVDPQTGVSVLERLRSMRLTRGTSEEKKEARDREDLRLGALGSGSDYTAFLDHLGIASLDLRFGGEGGGGSYHSIYDSVDHYQRFVDPGYAYGVALVKTAGRVMLRLADAETPPFSFAASAEAIAGYAKEVEKLADDLRKETEERNRLIREKRYEAAADPTQAYVPPKPLEPVPPIDFAALKKAVEKLSASAKAAKVVERSYLAERALTRPEGLPRRPWFKHLIYAPGFYTGYGVKTLPGIREALEERDWAEARLQIAAAAAAIEGYAAEIERAASK
jgi:N-acetylated-alpha-linked acidic dipeptidase